jgi:hypothetical protein
MSVRTQFGISAAGAVALATVAARIGSVVIVDTGMTLLSAVMNILAVL